MSPLQEAAAPKTVTVEPITVCLVGMPNAGKTTLMNAITGGHFQHCELSRRHRFAAAGHEQTGVRAWF